MKNQLTQKFEFSKKASRVPHLKTFLFVLVAFLLVLGNAKVQADDNNFNVTSYDATKDYNQAAAKKVEDTNFAANAAANEAAKANKTYNTDDPNAALPTSAEDTAVACGRCKKCMEEVGVDCSQFSLNSFAKPTVELNSNSSSVKETPTAVSH